MKTNNQILFLKTYRKNLEYCYKKNPSNYFWDISEIDDVFKRMNDAIIRGSFNKDSETFKLTCKELKIKHTYRDIEMFLGSA